MNKKYLILADFITRENFYSKAINKTFLSNKSVIILVPDLSAIPYFEKILKKYQKNLSILHFRLNKTQRWLTWNQIRSRKNSIVIGSQSALFSPVKNLGLIIIDQEENDAYKSDRSPRFHAVNVAEKLAIITNANLILGTSAPRVETFFQASHDSSFRILKKTLCNQKDISVIDMNSEKYVISNPLEQEIEKTLATKQKVVLVLNRKGEGTKFSCTDCGWIAVCEKCGLPLIPQRSENVCFRCQKSYRLPASCPKCQSVHLKPFGLGTNRLKKFLNDLFFKAKIIQVEKELDDRLITSTWDIAISTSYGLKFNWPKIGLTGIIDADQSLNFPDFSSPQKTFQNFSKFLRIGERGIIQTHLPENYVIKALARLNYETFFLDEIALRRKFHLPPYTRLVRLLFKSVDKEKVIAETQRVFKQLSLIITDNKLPIILSAPHACFSEKERGKYRWQIIIKSSKPITNYSSLTTVIRSLSKGWIVDVDPQNLL